MQNSLLNNVNVFFYVFAHTLQLLFLFTHLENKCWLHKMHGCFYSLQFVIQIAAKQHGTLQSNTLALRVGQQERFPSSWTWVASERGWQVGRWVDKRWTAWTWNGLQLQRSLPLTRRDRQQAAEPQSALRDPCSPLRSQQHGRLRWSDGGTVLTGYVRKRKTERVAAQKGFEKKTMQTGCQSITNP